MKRWFLAAGLLLIFSVPQLAQAAGSQYPDPNRQTMWNSVTDSMHTFGQNPQQKKMTIMKLHNARTNARLHSINRDAAAKRKAKIAAWRKTQENAQPSN